MDTRNFTFMFYGFAAVWVILFAYVVWIAARERRISRELARVRDMVGADEHSKERA